MAIEQTHQETMAKAMTELAVKGQAIATQTARLSLMGHDQGSAFRGATDGPCVDVMAQAEQQYKLLVAESRDKVDRAYRATVIALTQVLDPMAVLGEPLDEMVLAWQTEQEERLARLPVQIQAALDRIERIPEPTPTPWKSRWFDEHLLAFDNFVRQLLGRIWG